MVDKGIILAGGSEKIVPITKSVNKWIHANCDKPWYITHCQY